MRMIKTNAFSPIVLVSEVGEIETAFREATWRFLKQFNALKENWIKETLTSHTRLKAFDSAQAFSKAKISLVEKRLVKWNGNISEGFNNAYAAEFHLLKSGKLLSILRIQVDFSNGTITKQVSSPKNLKKIKRRKKK